jgi:hypothetical protein
MRLPVRSFPLIAGALLGCSSLPLATPLPHQNSADFRDVTPHHAISLEDWAVDCRWQELLLRESPTMAGRG